MKKVVEELDSLKKEIVATPEIDETAEPYTALIKDIDLVLENPGEFPFAHHEMFVQKLEDALLKFEAQHPKLVKQLQAVVDSLNEVGI